MKEREREEQVEALTIAITRKSAKADTRPVRAFTLFSWSEALPI